MRPDHVRGTRVRGSGARGVVRRVHLGVDLAPVGAGERADLRLGVVGGVHGVAVRGTDHPGPARAGVQLHHLVAPPRSGADGDDPLAVGGHRGGELGPGARGVDDLTGLRVEYAEPGGAPAVQDGDQPALQRGEPAVAQLPQRAAELLLARAERLPVPVEVPPAGAVAGVQQPSVVGPVGLGDGLLGSAGHRAGAVQGAVRGDVGEDQFGAVPRHARMVPAEPGRAPSVGREPRPGDEPVPPVAQFPHRVAVVGGGAVQRDRGQDAAHVAGAVAGELLQDAPHLAALRQQHRIGPAQPLPHRRHGRERAVLAARVVAVEALVGEVHEHHQRGAVAHGAGPGPAAVLDDPGPHVPRRRQHRLLGAVAVPAHQGAPAGLGGPGLGPPHLVADEVRELGAAVVGRGGGRVDGRGPLAVRQGLHCLPHSLRPYAGTGRGPGHRSGAPRRERARRPRGRAPGSRSPPAASAGRSRSR